MSISSNIVSLLNGESVVHTDEYCFVEDDKKDLSWLELMDKMHIYATEDERLAWAQDIHDVKNNVPSQIEMLLSSALTPSGRLFRSLFSFSDRQKMSQSVVLEEIPLVPYIKSNSGMKDHAEDYVTYLRILHDYMPYVDVFNNIQSEMNPLYPRRRQAVLNGCLLYRKLLEAGAIQKGQKISLEEGLSSADVWALVGRFPDGREMTIDEQADQMQKIVDKYLDKQEKKQMSISDNPSSVVLENTLTEVNNSKTPNFWQTMKRDWRAMKRRRQHRRATTPGILEILGAAFVSPKRRPMRQSVPLSVRWPMLGALASMVRRPGPKKNFFQMMLDDLRPLIGYRHKPERTYYEEERIEVEEQDVSPFTEEEEEMMQKNPELAQLILEKQGRMDELKNRSVSIGYRVKDFLKAFIWMSDADKLDREYSKKYQELFHRQEAEAHPDKKTLWQKISEKLHRQSVDNESEGEDDQDGEVTLYEDSWWDKLQAKLATPVDLTRLFKRKPKTVETEETVKEVQPVSAVKENTDNSDDQSTDEAVAQPEVMAETPEESIVDDRSEKLKALLAQKEAILSKKGNSWRLEKKKRKERVLKTVPVVHKSKENGNEVTTLYYSKLNKIVRIVAQPTGMKVVTAIWLKRKIKATYWERTNENGLIERLATAYGDPTYGKEMVTLSSPDGIQKRRNWLSTSELAHWQTAMNRVRFQEKTRKRLERIAERQKAKELVKAQGKVARKKRTATR